MYIFQDKLNLVLFPPARIQIHVNWAICMTLQSHWGEQKALGVCARETSVHCPHCPLKSGEGTDLPWLWAQGTTVDILHMSDTDTISFLPLSLFSAKDNMPCPAQTGAAISGALVCPQSLPNILGLTSIILNSSAWGMWARSWPLLRHFLNLILKSEGFHSREIKWELNSSAFI